ncbi:unnamed protein product [Hydatigera taeniaeformis]|uniref:Uncharacterized protein n=1 Tax=Hydatigena taeniaeformis TaxID=6205 RepID=A0A0R3X7H0_HYDTA|nr:unnamed protein product [Hydatigera taeniaeformis]
MCCRLCDTDCRSYEDCSRPVEVVYLLRLLLPSGAVDGTYDECMTSASTLQTQEATEQPCWYKYLICLGDIINRVAAVLCPMLDSSTPAFAIELFPCIRVDVCSHAAEYDRGRFYRVNVKQIHRNDAIRVRIVRQRRQRNRDEVRLLGVGRGSQVIQLSVRIFRTLHVSGSFQLRWSDSGDFPTAWSQGFLPFFSSPTPLLCSGRGCVMLVST